MGGGSRAPIMTAYRQRALACAALLAARPPSSTASSQATTCPSSVAVSITGPRRCWSPGVCSSNEATLGGGLFNGGPEPVVVNSTFVKHSWSEVCEWFAPAFDSDEDDEAEED